MVGDVRYKNKFVKGLNNYRKNELCVKRTYLMVFVTLFLGYVILNIQQILTENGSVFQDTLVLKYATIAEGVIGMLLFIFIFIVLINNLRKYHRLEYETNLASYTYLFVAMILVYLSKSFEFLIITLCSNSSSAKAEQNTDHDFSQCKTIFNQSTGNYEWWYVIL